MTSRMAQSRSYRWNIKNSTWCVCTRWKILVKHSWVTLSNFKSENNCKRLYYLFGTNNDFWMFELSVGFETHLINKINEKNVRRNDRNLLTERLKIPYSLKTWSILALVWVQLDSTPNQNIAVCIYFLIWKWTKVISNRTSDHL